jgi:putative endonuclease
MNMRERGDRGEAQAAAYLEKNNCIRGGEVDIIFKDGDTIVFCEVKTRTQNRFGTPAEAVTAVKQRRICRAALDYAYQKKCIDESIRFDIIEVMSDKINHIKSAFEFVEDTGER